MVSDADLRRWWTVPTFSYRINEIVSESAEKQVSRIHTRPHITSVANEETSRNVAVVDFVRHSVG